MSALNDEITRQSLNIAYVDDFKLMLWVSLPTALLLLFMRKPRVAATPSAEHAVLD